MEYLKWLFFLCSVSELRAVPILMSWTSSLKLLESQNPSNITAATATTHLAIAVDYHYKRGEIYYSDGTGRICRDWLRGASVTRDPIVIAEVMLVDGLAVDWDNDNLYWADMTLKTVEMATLDGLNRRVLFNAMDGVDRPRAIVVDPSEGLLFWSDWGSSSQVSSSGLDGKDLRIISSNFLWPNGLTLDLNQKKLYILDGLRFTLSSCNYDGTNLQTILTSNTLLQQAFGLTYYANNLYWTSWKETALISMNVESEHTNVVYKRRDWKGAVERMMGVKAIHTSLQPESSQASPCADKHCSHHCLPGRKGTASCTCPFGFSLDHDEETCVEQGYLLVSWRKTIRRYDFGKIQDQRMIDSTKAAIAIDYHLQKGLVFWSDIEEHRIYRAFLDQMNNMTVVATVETCDGLAVDWVHDVLYWTDVSKNILEAASLDGNNRKVIVSKDLDQPRAVILDPFDGLLFWSDWGINPKIERADLDGSNRKTIVSNGLSWPNGITIDFDEKRLYWVDGKLKLISSCLYDGTQRKHIIGPQTTFIQPFGISLFENNIYWTDWGRQALMKCSKTDIIGRTDMLINSSSLYLRPNGIKFVHSSLQREQENPCVVLNCKSLCLGSLSGPRKAQCMGEESEPDVNVTVTSSLNPESESNELDDLTMNIGNDSFQLLMSGVKMPSYVVISLNCIKREGCSEDKQCSGDNNKTQLFTNNEMSFTITGLLPATKYGVYVTAPHNKQEFHITTIKTDPPELPNIKSVDVKGTAVTIKWDPVDTCVPNFQSYNYRIYKTAELDKLVLEGSTNLTEVTLQDLESEVDFILHLYTSKRTHFTSTAFETQADEKLLALCQKEELICDGVKDCMDGRDENINLCAGIEKVIAYKKTQTEAYFRCDVTNRTANHLLKFTGKYRIAGSDVYEKFEVPATPCTVWPDSYCFHISSLRGSKVYNVNVSAVVTGDVVGNPVPASVFTKEGQPGPPEDLRVVSYSPTDVEIKWRHPNQSNGILRNFIINVHEVETFEEGKCCLSFPMIESPVQDEEPEYSAKPGGFSPASTYAISITAKTLYLGGSKEIDVQTPPPHMEILRTPDLWVSSLTPISWQPRSERVTDQPQYHTLIKSYLLLLFAQKTDPQSSLPDTGIEIGPLKAVLEMNIKKGFSVLWKKNLDDEAAFKEPITVDGLALRKQYTLAWVQVSQYKDVYTTDYIISDPFIAV